MGLNSALLSFLGKPTHSSSPHPFSVGDAPIFGFETGVTVKTLEVAYPSLAGVLNSMNCLYKPPRRSCGLRHTHPIYVWGPRIISSYKFLKVSYFLELAQVIFQSPTVLGCMTSIPIIRAKKVLVSPWYITSHLVCPSKVRLVFLSFPWFDRPILYIMNLPSRALVFEPWGRNLFLAKGYNLF